MSYTRTSFDLQYLLHRPPWDTQVTPPEVVELLDEGSVRPGRALDLGCGTGTNSVALAQYGWTVVGVDFSMVAIRRARRRARRAGISCQFYRADVTDLAFLAHPFDLALDIGCLHSVPAGGWVAYATEVARLVRPGGLYMLYAFVPGDGPGPSGIAPGEVHSLFTAAFTLARQEGGDDPTGPRSAWYWMQRRQ